MDAIKFIETLQRKLKTENKDKITIRLTDDAGLFVDLVEEWSKEHPVKTRQSVLLEQFPNVKLDENGIIDILPCLLDTKQHQFNGDDCHTFMSCSKCRKEFWMQEVE